MIQFLKNVISKQFDELDKDKTVVLLPFGAIEQHGKHLPVGTDSIILEALLTKFSLEKDIKEGNVIIAPQLWVGKSNEHMNFSGTMTFTAPTMYTIVDELVASLVKSGFKKILLTNSHGGNTDLLNLVSRDLRIKYDIEVYVFDWWFTPFWQELLKTEKDSESLYGVFHACELETSLIMYIAPHLVEESSIIDETPETLFKDKKYLSLYGPITMGWKTTDVTESGVIGSPSFATREKGEKMMQYAVDKLTDIVSEIIRFQY